MPSAKAGSDVTDADPQSPPLQPVERRGLRALLAANGISAVGDGAFLAAAPLAAAAVTRNPTAVAIVAAAEYLPWLLVSPLAGVYVDRWAKRPTMIWADLLRGLGVAVLAVLVAFHLATIPAIAVCAAAMVTGMVFHSAAAEAVIADLTGRDEAQLHRVNGRLQATSTTGRQLVGPPAGSWSFALVGWLPFAADAVSFLASATLLVIVPARPRQKPAQGKLWAAIREGTNYLVRHRELRTLALLTAAGNVSVATAMATLVLFATDRHGLGVTTAAYGVLLAAMAVGGVVGGLVAGWVTGRLGGRVAVIAGLAIEAAAWLLLAFTRNAVVAGLLLCLLWVSFAVLSVVIMGTRQRQTPPELLGRVISAYRLVGNGMSPLGALLGGFVATVWGLRAPMVAAGLILILAVLIAIRDLRTA